jgi:hypothetical protein
VFSPEWLALREPADFAARSLALTLSAGAACDRRETLRGLDLACGTGANTRYLAQHLPHTQDWLLVDHDSALLSRLPALMTVWSARRGVKISAEAGVIRTTGPEHEPASFTIRYADLRALEPGLFEGRGLLTASALLDRVSEPWLTALAGRCRANDAAALFALTYDGRITCWPEEPEDEIVRQLVNSHQRTDKGFGPALGPSAVERVERHFVAYGYHCLRERSDWILEPDTTGLQRALIEGWAAAATAIAPSMSETIARWRGRRLGHVGEGLSRLVVGHEDTGFWLE